MMRAVHVARAVGFLAGRLTPGAFVLIVAGWRFALAFVVGQLVGGAGWRLRLPAPPVVVLPPPDDDDDDEPRCSDLGGHAYRLVDDGSRDGRMLCIHCGADGDA